MFRSRVHRLGTRDEGLRSKIQGLEFRVWRLGVWDVGGRGLVGAFHDEAHLTQSPTIRDGLGPCWVAHGRHPHLPTQAREGSGKKSKYLGKPWG